MSSSNNGANRNRNIYARRYFYSRVRARSAEQVSISEDDSGRWSNSPVVISEADTTSNTEQGEPLTLADFLKYCIPPHSLFENGYPVECEIDRNMAVIYGTPKIDSPYLYDDRIGMVSNEWMITRYYYSPQYIDDDSGYDPVALVLSGVCRIYPTITRNPYYYFVSNVLFDTVVSEDLIARDCVRCNKIFYTNVVSNEYATVESCYYHWGKLRQVYGFMAQAYICCGYPIGSPGCTAAELHVWDGLVRGKLNGPFTGFVKTLPNPRRNRPPSEMILGLDCEMCFTIRGFEACKVTVVNLWGDLVYNSFIRPGCRVIDHNTRFSGVTPDDLNNAGSGNIPVKTLQEVQNDLLKLIYCDTVIVGHGLENDLRVLQIIHMRVVDTAIVFPHYYGLPFKRSLKSLAFHYLNRQIQSRVSGHDSREDAKSCLDLMEWKIQHDREAS